ncbi:MAG: tetratricopeptide repeat-containing sulfotransferase family protein [Woeseiaceae bacterium]
MTTRKSEIQEQLDAASGLLRDGRVPDALTSIKSLLELDPDLIDGLYILAVCQRLQKNYDDALATLARLQDLQPAYGRARQEQGHVYRATGQSDAALQAYRHAVSLNNSLIASWKAIVELTSNDSHPELANEAKFQHGKLAALPAELLSVRNMTAEGRYFKAERLCRHYLQNNRQNVEGMRLLADLGVKSGVLDDAEFLLESALEFEPNNPFARHDYMTVLYRRQKYEQSLGQAKILVKSDPDNLNYQISFANQSVAVGDYDSALEIYDRAIVERPNNPELHLVHGHALKTIGQLEPAVDAYRNAYRSRPNFGDAFWSLANLKTYRFTDTEVSTMQSGEADAATVVEDRAHLCFALGKHLEDVEEYADSAEYYLRGNALRKSQLRYDAEEMTHRINLQREICTESLFRKHENSGHKSADPIFIVGLPRAGSTLLEQILASHSKVDGTLELPNIPALGFQLAGRRRADEEPLYPAVLHDLTAKRLQELGQAFIEDTQVHRQGAAFFIDKMPNNFRHIGLIQLILPNAKIIDARRHPLACCFSGFKQLFASGQEFTYGLDEIGTYYKNYVELMDHWDAVLPGKILRVQYEDVVADLETEVRRILDYCGLPFEEGCLAFHETERSVRTPSSEQVRQSIYTSGLEQWRNFEPWLDPLKSALGPVLERYPITENSQAKAANND